MWSENLSWSLCIRFLSFCQVHFCCFFNVGFSSWCWTGISSFEVGLYIIYYSYRITYFIFFIILCFLFVYIQILKLFVNQLYQLVLALN